MSATTDTTPHNGTPHNKSTVIRTKRLSFKGRAVTHKSKSSPALLTEKTIAKPVPSCQTMIDLT
jgi:hypothetical protein